MRLVKKRSVAGLGEDSKGKVSRHTSSASVSAPAGAAGTVGSSKSSFDAGSAPSTRPSSPEGLDIRHEKRRDNSGANRYPPSSFQSHGWSSGKMRSFRRRRKDSNMDVTSESEGEGDDGSSSRVFFSTRGTSASPSTSSPWSALQTSRASHTPSPVSPLPLSGPSKLGAHLRPDSSTVGLALSTDDLPSSDRSYLPVSPPAQTSARESNPQIISPLGADPGTQTSWRQEEGRLLLKKRPASMAYDKYQSMEMNLIPEQGPVVRRSRSSSNASRYPNSPILTVISGASPIPPVPPLPSLSPILRCLPLPEGAAAPELNPGSSYFLNRNPSITTSQGSSAEPSTEESTCIVTPTDRNGAMTVPHLHMTTSPKMELDPIPSEDAVPMITSDSLQLGPELRATATKEPPRDCTSARHGSPQGSPTVSKGSSSKTVTPNGSLKGLRIRTDLSCSVFSDETASPIAPGPRSERMRSPLEGFTPLPNNQALSESPLPPKVNSSLAKPQSSFSSHVTPNSAYSLEQSGDARKVLQTEEEWDGEVSTESAIMLRGLDQSLSMSPISDPNRKIGHRPAPFPPHLSPSISGLPLKSAKYIPPSPSLAHPDSREPDLDSLKLGRTPDPQEVAAPLPDRSESPSKPPGIVRSSSFGKLLRSLSYGKGSRKKPKKPKGSLTGHEDTADEKGSVGGETSDFGFSMLHLKDLRSGSLTSPLKMRSRTSASPEVSRTKSSEENFKVRRDRPSPAPSQPSREEIGPFARRNSFSAPRRAPSSVREIQKETLGGLMVSNLDPSDHSSRSACTSASASNAELSGLKQLPSPDHFSIHADNDIASLMPSPSEGIPPWRTLLGPYTPPELPSLPSYFHPSRPYSPSAPSSPRAHSRLLANEDAEQHSHEVRRRYRQSLVNIKDDREFAYMLEEFARIESDPRARTALGGGISLASSTRGNAENAEDGESETDGRVVMKYRSRDVLEKKAKQQSIAAWFVTREIVQGESRHARLLARGLRVAKTAAVKSKDKDLLPGVSPIPAGPKSAPGIPFNHADQLVPPLPRPKGHYRTGSVPSILRKRRTSLSEHRSQLGVTPHDSPMPPVFTEGASARRKSTPSPLLSMPSPSPPPVPSYSALAILLARLPILLDISLNLSSAFSHDASPYGVAHAFVEMEVAITREVGRWAGEIGGIVVSEVTETLNRIMEDEKKRRKKGECSVSDDEYGDERLAYLDIIMMPIQRASRYMLLFQELSTKIPPASTTHNKILAAIEASRRLAAQCDACQVMDLDLLRRQGKKNKKMRPVSTGPNSKTVALWSSAE